MSCSSNVAFQTRQTKLDFHQEQAAEKMLKKASKGVCQLRGQNHKEPIQVQTFRWGETHASVSCSFYCHTFVIIKTSLLKKTYRKWRTKGKSPLLLAFWFSSDLFFSRYYFFSYYL